MKTYSSAVLRAVVAVVVGVLLISYRKAILEWIIILTGVLFFLSGCLSCLTYYWGIRKARRTAPVVDEQGRPVGAPKPSWPISGVGSLLVGLILTLMPNTDSFIRGVAYGLACLLILGAINQFVRLGGARRYARIPLFYWLLPAVTLAVGVIVVLKPIETMASPLLVIGWCMVFYGVVELLNTLKIYQLQRQYRKAEEASVVVGKPQAELEQPAQDAPEGE